MKNGVNVFAANQKSRLFIFGMASITHKWWNNETGFSIRQPCLLVISHRQLDSHLTDSDTFTKVASEFIENIRHVTVRRRFCACSTWRYCCSDENHMPSKLLSASHDLPNETVEFQFRHWNRWTRNHDSILIIQNAFWEFAIQSANILNTHKWSANFKLAETKYEEFLWLLFWIFVITCAHVSILFCVLLSFLSLSLSFFCLFCLSFFFVYVDLLQCFAHKYPNTAKILPIRDAGA